MSFSLLRMTDLHVVSKVLLMLNNGYRNRNVCLWNVKIIHRTGIWPSTGLDILTF